jgi:hypothetical protein
MSEKSVTPGQKEHFGRLLNEVLDGSGLLATDVQEFFSNGRKVTTFKGQLGEMLQSLIISTPANAYEGEKEEQSCYYPKGWSVPSLNDLETRLQEAIPGLSITLPTGDTYVPQGFDGMALVPKLSALARILGVDDPYGSGYGELLEKVLGIISGKRSFYNYRNGVLGSNYLRLHDEVRGKLEALESEMDGDVLVVPISFGNLYAGYSARNARHTSLGKGQLPLGSVQVACLLLSMPERLVSYDDLWIDCPADEYNDDADGEWSCSPDLSFVDGLSFYAGWSDNARGYCGSAVAALGV